MTTKTPKFTVSRKQAAEILEVSTRTIDRYIRDKKLGARKKGGNIMLNEEEVSHFRVAKFQSMHGASPSGPGRVHRHVDSVAPKAATIVDEETGQIEESKTPAPAQTAVAKSSGRDQVFEELYDLSRREIREYHNKLEAANYRLGQLETQLKHSVPLLEHQETKEMLDEQEKMVQEKIKRQSEAIDILEQEVRGERLNKNVYIGLLFGLLALQPLLWLFLQG